MCLGPHAPPSLALTSSLPSLLLVRQAEADLKDSFERQTAELKAANEKLAATTRWLEEEKARSDALLYRMSGLIACFPGQGDAAAVAKEAAAIMQTGGSSGHGPAPGTSEDGGLPPGSVAAVAALLRQAGVRAPSTVGDSTAMMARDGSYAVDYGSGSQNDRKLNAIGAAARGAPAPLPRCSLAAPVRLVPPHGPTRAPCPSHPTTPQDRIEAVRRELTKANVNVGETDSITCCELLVRHGGEGLGGVAG